MGQKVQLSLPLAFAGILDITDRSTLDKRIDQ